MVLEIYIDHLLTRSYSANLPPGSNVSTVIPRNGGAKLRTRLPFTMHIRNAGIGSNANFDMDGNSGPVPNVMVFNFSPITIPPTAPGGQATANVTLIPSEVLTTLALPIGAYDGGEVIISIRNNSSFCDLELTFISI